MAKRPLGSIAIVFGLLGGGIANAQETLHFYGWPRTTFFESTMTWDLRDTRAWAGYFPVTVEQGYNKYSWAWYGESAGGPFPVNMSLDTPWGTIGDVWSTVPGATPNPYVGGIVGGVSATSAPGNVQNPPWPPNTILNIDGAGADVPKWIELATRRFIGTGISSTFAFCSIHPANTQNVAEFNVQRGNHRLSDSYVMDYPSQFFFTGGGGRGMLSVVRRMALGYSGSTLALDILNTDIVNGGETVIGTLSSNSVVQLRNSTFQVGGTNSSTVGEFSGTGRLVIDQDSSYNSVGASPLVGAFGGGNGTIDVSGTLDAVHTPYVGYLGGTGRINVNGTGAVSSDEDLVIGHSGGSSGSLYLSGISPASPAAVSARTMLVANWATGLFQSSQGQVSMLDHLIMGIGSGVATVNLAHSHLSGGGRFAIGDTGTANMVTDDVLIDFNNEITQSGTSSSNLVHSRLFTDGNFTLGTSSGAHTPMTASDTQIRATQALNVGSAASATLSMTRGSLNAGDTRVGQGAAAGNLTLNNTPATLGSLTVAPGTGACSFSLNEGSVVQVVRDATFGSGGSATATIGQGCTLNVAGALNAGTFATGTQIINLGQNSQLLVATNAIVGTNSSTTVTLQDGSLGVTGSLLNGPQGVIRGTGTLTHGSLTNQGFIDPGFSPGTLTFNGPVTNSTGVIRLELGTPTNSDKLIINGSFTMTGGEMRFESLPGSTYSVGETFDVIQANSINILGGVLNDQTGLGLQFNPSTGKARVTRLPGFLTAQISLSDWTAGEAGMATQYELIQYQSVVQSGNLTLGDEGLGGIPTSFLGQYQLRVKGSHWLSRVQPVTLLSGGSSVAFFSLINGDVDGDNEVGPGDFGGLSAAFGSIEGDSNWNMNADLDGDGEVGPSDFGVLSANFGQAGE